MASVLKKAFKALLAAFGLGEDRTITRVTRTFYAPDARHRLFVYLRANGAYGFQEEVYDDRSLDQRWAPAKETQPPDYDTEDEALAAARAEIPWFAALPD